jgi:Kef-type K+ transport system membrane component KefB
VLAMLLAVARRGVREGGRLATVVLLGQHETAQITLRATILLLIVLIAVTNEFHLDAVLGAFLAGVVLRHWVGGQAPVLEGKLDAVGYGFFVPIFFGCCCSSRCCWPSGVCPRCWSTAACCRRGSACRPRW